MDCQKAGYIRHEQDCSRFYECETDTQESNKTKATGEYGCPPGLIFDEHNKVCNWPSWSTSCVGSGEILTVNREKFSCPSYGYFQNPDNCEYFYYCSDFGNGLLKAYEFKCPFDLAFDEEKLLCNWKWLVRRCGSVKQPAGKLFTTIPS